MPTAFDIFSIRALAGFVRPPKFMRDVNAFARAIYFLENPSFKVTVPIIDDAKITLIHPHCITVYFFLSNLV